MSTSSSTATSCASADQTIAPPHIGLNDARSIAINQTTRKAALLALQGLRDVGRIRPGQRVLINGAGGGAGTFAVQLAKLYGVELTAVDRPGKLAMLRALGADRVIDYTREDFTRGGRRYDLILDVKTSRSIIDCARALDRGGTFVTLGGATPRLFQALLLLPVVAATGGKALRVVVLKPNKDLGYMNELFDAGKLTPVIDGPYRFRELPDAMRHFGTGDHQGKVVITLSHGGNP